MRLRSLLFSISLLLPLCLYAAPKTASLNVDATLYSQPDARSKKVSHLLRGNKVFIEQRQGVWYRVKKEGDAQRGWIRSYNVQVQQNINWYSRLKRVISGGYAVESNSVATIGIRGLGPGELKKAAPNYKELKKLDSFKVNVSQGQRYASRAPLQSQDVAYLHPLDTGNSRTNNAANDTTQDTSQVLDDVVEGIGNLGGAVDSLKGLFGGGKK